MKTKGIAVQFVVGAFHLLFLAAPLLAEKGQALCLGINAVDPLHYKGEFRLLINAENDADAMGSIASKQGFQTEVIKASNAKRDNVLSKIEAAAGVLVEGDIFLLTFAGHGSVLPDKNRDELAENPYDQTWCLYDAQLIDDEIYAALSRFKTGVRVVLFSDSCHSGSIIKVVLQRTVADVFTARPEEWLKYRSSAKAKPSEHVYRFLPVDAARATYEANKDFYDKLLMKKPATEKDIKASAISIVACEDTEFASDNGGKNGVFTDSLLRTWRNGAFTGGYRSFHLTIRPTAQQKNPDQTSVRSLKELHGGNSRIKNLLR